MLAIASLTLREALRRRFALVAAIGTLIAIALSTWGLGRLSSSIEQPMAAVAVVSGLVILLAFIFSVIVALAAATFGSPAIASEVDSGIILSILPRPPSRAEYVIGKWLGVVAITGGFTAVAAGLELLAIHLATGYSSPAPAVAVGYLVVQSVTIATLAIFFSTRLPSIAGGLLAILAFGIAWIAGIAGTIASGFGNAPIALAATATSLVIPSDGLWRGCEYALKPVMLSLMANASGETSHNPFDAATGPTPLFLGWALLWICGVLALSVASFARRDV